jgi:hypothetical protein
MPAATFGRCLPFAAALALAASDANAFKCMPIYGNWCGPGHPPAGTAPPPVDAFDAACMRHDLCTAGPAPDKSCDMVLVSELHTLAQRYGYLPRPLQWAEYVIRVQGRRPLGRNATAWTRRRFGGPHEPGSALLVVPPAASANEIPSTTTRQNRRCGPPLWRCFRATSLAGCGRPHTPSASDE